MWRYTKRKPVREVSVRSRRSEASGWKEAARGLCDKHVMYGYRWVCVLLRRNGYPVGQHRLRLWMRESGLSQASSIKDDGRTVGEKPSEPTEPNQAWQIDATKIYTKEDGWAWQTSVLDVFDRRIVAYVLRKTARTEDAMDAVALALDGTFGRMRPEGLSLIHDRGSQFTAYSFKEMLRELNIKDVVTAVRHPQSCGRLERFHRTLKEECIWQEEWESIKELGTGVAEYIWHYNHVRIHSALGYRTPMEVYQMAVDAKTSDQTAA